MMIPPILPLEQLHILLEQKREQMIHMGLQYGFTNAKTISLSEEIDQIIIELLHLKKTTDSDDNK